MNRPRLFSIVSVLTLTIGAFTAWALAPSPSATTFESLVTELELLEQGEVVSVAAGCSFCIALKSDCLNAPTGYPCGFDPDNCACGFCDGRFDCVWQG